MASSRAQTCPEFRAADRPSGEKAAITQIRNVLIIGGTGFVGSALASRLAASGMHLRLAARRRERARHLLPLPTAEVVEADVHDPLELRRLMDGQDAVINLVGILQGGRGEPFGSGFARAHVELPQKITAAMRELGVVRLLHMSALKAAADAPSGYLRSKAAGEAAAQGAGLALTVFRPSVIFGESDAFLNLFARLLKSAPVLPLACPAALFQPVWVRDVAACMALALARPDAIGKCYELCGPRQYTLRQLVEYVAATSGRRRLVVGLPDTLSRLEAWAMEYLPGTPMSRDNVDSMRVPNVCAEDCRFPFGLAPTPLEAIAPAYLGRDAARAGS